MDTQKIPQLTANVVLDTKPDLQDLHKVYFRLKQGRVKRDIPTKIKWPKDFFDKRNQNLMPRYLSDPDVIPYNLKLNELKSIAHRIQLSGYLKDNNVTIDDVVKQFKSIGKTTEFFSFWEKKADEMYKDGVISNPTWRRHRSSLNMVKTFCKRQVLPIHNINLDWIQRFDAWARKTKKKAHNTVCGYHKDTKKYLGIAARMCLIDSNPYKDFSFAYVDGNREALEKEEVKALYNLLNDPRLEKNMKEVCRMFLFSCVTGLRISDIVRIHRNMIINDVLTFKPFKTEKKDKILKVPLSKVAVELIEGRSGKLFDTVCEQDVNKKLKVLAAHAGIYKCLTFRCSRDTFATLFLEMGGDVKSLKDLMGHEDIKTTMIYAKMSNKRKFDLMNNFNSIF